ncbi:hypothetical protein IC614_07980 [Allosphingosinicella flava]|uniref:Uncharacterized protein n=1 Tax=Allosphingosinicella flava TaxID=2771430 RepID=A0A7T2GI59_9SPHN|nr:hypothetical protein [Sphingosinicella flava]QPQ54298.1 hypothetical protein IC614_07980 [Sphingosinicella flava]
MTKWLLITLSIGMACAGCDSRGDGAKSQSAPPQGWKKVAALPGSGRLPAVTAALPSGMSETDESGIENPLKSFKGAGLFVRFDYGVLAHPGCKTSSCQIYSVKIGGRDAQASLSIQPANEDGFTTVHDYFVPIVQDLHNSSTSMAGSGLHITVRCAEKPRCADADQIVQTIRFGQ